MKRLLKVVLSLVAVVVVLLIGAFAAAALFLDLDKVVNDQIAKHKPEIEEKLGRKIAVGQVTTKLFPTLGGRIENVSVASDPNHKEDDRPLAQVGAVGFEIGLWDAIVSRGKDLRVKTVYLDGLKVNVVRYADGTLSYQDILDRQPKAAPEQPQQPAQPMSEETKERIRNASIGEIRLGDAEVRFVDHDTPTHQVAEEFIKHLNVNVRDLRISDPIKIHVDAAVFADAKNFEFDTQVGPLPADLELKGTPPLGETRLQMTAVDLSRIAPYLGPAVPAKINSAKADADLKVSGYADKGTTTVKGFMEVKNIQVAQGTPFDFRVDSDLSADTSALSLDVAKLDVKIGQVQIAMAGALKDLATKPSFHDFTVKSTSLAPGLLFSYYPPARKNLPPGYKLDGAATLDVKASGDATKQTVLANLDLAPMDILIPGSLAKPKGVAMGIKVDGDFTANDANLRKAEAILDELDLVASGTVKNFSAAQFDLNLAAKPFSFDRLARLLPSLRDQLQKQNATAQGQGRIDGHLKGTAQNLDAAMDLALTGVNLAVPGTTLNGNLTFKAVAKGDPNTNLVADVSLDGQQATIVVPNTLNKAASTPMLLTASVVRSGGNINVKQFDVRFAELAMHADGTFDQAKGTTNLRVAVQPLDLEKFAKTVTAIPPEKAKGGFVDVKVAVSGNPNKLETMSVAVDPLNVRYGGSDLKGQLQVTNLVKPNATMRVSSNKLDLDQLMGLNDAQAAKADPNKKKPEAKDDPSLKDITFTGNFDAKTMIYSQTELTNFKGVVKLVNGVLTVEQGNFNVFGGSVSASGTSAEIWRGKMPFHAKLNVQNVDVGQALAQKTKYGNTLQGRGNFNVDLQGVGFETPDLEQALTGNLDTSLTQGKYNAASLTQSVLGGFSGVLSKIPGMKTSPVKADNSISDLTAGFDVKQGKMNLKKPMVMSLDGNKLTLEGAIGIAGGLFLTGNYGLKGQMLTAVTGGKCKVNGDVPIPVKIGGTVSKPAFAPDVGGTAQNVLSACLTGQAGAMAKQAADQAKAQAEAQARAAASQAQQQAQQQAAAAKAQAESQARAQADAQKKAAQDQAAKAKADADRKAKEAADAAKKKANDALGGLHF